MPTADTVAVVIPTRDPLQAQRLVVACARVGISDIVVVHPGEPRELTPARSVATGAMLSPALARNRGAQATRAPFLCFIDDDVHLDAQGILRLAHTCAQAGTVAAAPWLVDAPHDGYWRRCMHRVMHGGHQDDPDNTTVPTFTSMCLCVSRTVFATVGGFPSRYDAPAGEDTAFVVAVAAHGTVCRVSGLTMTHDPQPDGWWPASRRLFRYGMQWPLVAPHSRAAWWHRWAENPPRRMLLMCGSVWLALLDACATVTPRYWFGVWWLRWCWYIGVLSARTQEA